MQTRRTIIKAGLGLLLPLPALAMPLLNAGGAKPQHPIAPELLSVTDVGNASHSVLNGQYFCTCGEDSSVRFNFDLAAMVNGATYRVDFTLVAINVGSVYADFCDVDPQQGPLAVGPISFFGALTVYDSTYRFVDIGTDALGEVPQAIFLVTPPTLTRTA